MAVASLSQNGFFGDEFTCYIGYHATRDPDEPRESIEQIRNDGCTDEYQGYGERNAEPDQLQFSTRGGTDGKHIVHRRDGI